MPLHFSSINSLSRTHTQSIPIPLFHPMRFLCAYKNVHRRRTQPTKQRRRTHYTLLITCEQIFNFFLSPFARHSMRGTTKMMMNSSTTRIRDQHQASSTAWIEYCEFCKSYYWNKVVCLLFSLANKFVLISLCRRCTLADNGTSTEKYRGNEKFGGNELHCPWSVDESKSRVFLVNW